MIIYVVVMLRSLSLLFFLCEFGSPGCVSMSVLWADNDLARWWKLPQHKQANGSASRVWGISQEF